MNTFVRSEKRYTCIWVVVLLMVVVSGCRTYGRYGNEAATLEEIRETNRLFAAELERARADLQVLERAASENPLLVPLLERFAAVVEAHDVLLEGHAALAEEAEEAGDDYRRLHRIYGAIVTDRLVIHHRYRQLVESLATLADTSLLALDRGIAPESRYQVAPQYYERLRYATWTSRALSELVARVPAGPSLVPGEGPGETPEPPSRPGGPPHFNPYQ